jgi:hypothetical protein
MIMALRDEARATWDEMLGPADGFYLDSGQVQMKDGESA